MAAERYGIPPYPLETTIVYNTALDAVQPEDEIHLIITSDNPGKDEQLAANQKYLVGQAGKLCNRFFSLNPSLGIDFRKNAIVLNKTPIHSARTNHLRLFLKQGGEPFKDLFEKTERFMARETLRLSAALSCPLWIVGYSELSKGGVFAVYADELNAACAADETGFFKENLFLFQHFSMNRFFIDLRDANYLKGFESRPLLERLKTLGKAHRREILGW